MKEKIFKYKVIPYFLTLVILLYSFTLCFLPKILNSPENTQKYEKFFSSKTSIKTNIEDFYISISPLLSVTIGAKAIKLEDCVYVDNISFQANIFNIKNGKLSTDSVNIDAPKLKQKLPPPDDKDKKTINLSNLPKLNLNNIYIKLGENSKLELKYINTDKTFGTVKAKIYGQLESDNLKAPMVIGETGKIIYNKHLGFENFSVRNENSTLVLNGLKNKISIKGKDLPAGELKDLFLYYYKYKHPDKKNFIENFHELSGLLDVDLVFSNGEFNGVCILKELKALFFDFKIPIYLPNTVFNFKGREIDASTKGTFGPNPVETDFHLTGLATKDLLVKGNVSSVFTNELTKKYYPAVGIIGNADALVNYKTKDGQVDIDYILTLNKGNDLTLLGGELGNTNKLRRISAHTKKIEDTIFLTEYKYSYVGDNSEYKLLSGNGKFEKTNGKYKLQTIKIKTNSSITLNALSPLIGNYIKGGTFESDLEYNTISNNINGYINIFNTYHEDIIYVEDAKLKVEDQKVFFNADGTFYGSPVHAEAIVENQLNKNILIHDIFVHLKEFKVSRGKITSIQPKKSGKKEKTNTKNKYNYTVENGHAKVDRIYGSKFKVKNVDIIGGLKNNVADFVIPQAEYAGGLLSAKGIYDMNDYSSDIEFYASDIDSNIVVSNFFKLPDQVEGIAYASLHFISKNKLNNIKANATFAITDGYLPKIGSREFMIKVSKSKKQSKFKIVNKIKSKINIKFTLSDAISNFDSLIAKNPNYTNIYGSFNVDNEKVKDVKVFTKNKFLSSFIEGNYDIETQKCNLAVWGRRNKTFAKKIKIFKIPLNLIYNIAFRKEHTTEQYQDKIKLIPEIRTNLGDEISTFRVFVSGNLNKTEKLEVELKDIR